MTNEEALKWLTDLRASLTVPCGSALSEERKQFAEAVDVAIDALERDRWISVDGGPYSEAKNALEMIYTGASACHENIACARIARALAALESDPLEEEPEDVFNREWLERYYERVTSSLPEPPKEET